MSILCVILQKIVDSTGALELKEIPKKMAVVGGGVIGLEMGSVWRRLGTEVHVIEFLDNIIPGTDLEITKTFLRTLKKQGMKFKLKTKVTKSEVLTDDAGVKLTTEASAGGKEKEEVYDVVLVSTGRRPFTEGLGLESMGIEMDRLGRVVTDEHFKTNSPRRLRFFTSKGSRLKNRWPTRRNRVSGTPKSTVSQVSHILADKLAGGDLN